MPRCHGATPWSVRKCADPQPDPKPSVPNSQLIMLICTATCHAAMQPYWIGTLWTSRNCKKCSWMWLPSASVSKAQTSVSTSTHLGVLPNSVLQIIWCLETKQVLTATWHMRYRVKCKHSPLAWKILEHIRELSQEKQLQTQEIQLEILCQKKWNIMKISDIETLNRNLKKNLADFWFRQIFSTDFSISGRVSAQKFKVSVRLEPSEVPPAIPRTWEMGYQWDMLEYIGIILGIGIYNDI